ncbi:glycine zipper 2TM domain-containing protein [Desulfobulbus sp. F1]|nr:glycine zipper 2TM domain-containing protein [Desulfobulbus sp. F1]
MKKTHLMGAALTVFLFSSCVGANKAQMGGVGGAAAGAIAGQAIGKNTGATLIGAVVGGTLAYMIGNEMDKYDQQQLNRAYETAPSGQAVSWNNPDNRNEYQVTPQPAYTGPNNQVCRNADILVSKNGNAPKQDSVTACRNQDGTWQIAKR